VTEVKTMVALRLVALFSVLVASCSADDTEVPASEASVAATPSSAVVDPGQVDDIIEAFGVNRQLAECINLELGDVANIDPSELTPELLSRSVCGTSLVAILSGATTGG